MYSHDHAADPAARPKMQNSIELPDISNAACAPTLVSNPAAYILCSSVFVVIDAKVSPRCGACQQFNLI